MKEQSTSIHIELHRRQSVYKAVRYSHIVKCKLHSWLVLTHLTMRVDVYLSLYKEWRYQEKNISSTVYIRYKGLVHRTIDFSQFTVAVQKCSLY